MSENQELSENLGFDDEIDILLYQNGAEQINEAIGPTVANQYSSWTNREL